MSAIKFPWQDKQKHWENQMDRYSYDILRETKLSEQKLNDILGVLHKYDMLKED